MIKIACEVARVRNHLSDNFPITRETTVKIKNVRRGHAYKGKNKIYLPAWLETREEEFITYYVIHEFVHIIAPLGEHHGPLFKKIESILCEQFQVTLDFGPTQKGRKRNYPLKVNKL